MATTYEAIATVEVGAGGAANIEFTSIPQTYTDLVILLSARTTYAQVGDGIIAQFNSNTSNLSTRRLYGTGSATGSDSYSFAYAGYANGSTGTANTFGNSYLYIPNYAGSNNKSFSTDGVAENNATTGIQALAASLWSNTAAITSIKLLSENASNFAQYSTATLYGIKNS